MSSTGLTSLIQSGTRVWLDSVDPKAVAANKAQGVSGATSNPAIIAGLVNSGDFDDDIKALIEGGQTDDEALTWAITDKLVGDAQKQFHDVWKKTECNDGWVSFRTRPPAGRPRQQSQRRRPRRAPTSRSAKSGMKATTTA